ncbi:MAG: hypothetical protein A2Z99_07885 [Treponema sp. GWB1_62_6]|nr:MAG: hypothetical protein A2Z99_07885 [Treponema sp. GWB1_62_6]HCM26139.1 hypothetical protein [Treponema sp.]
MEGATEAVLQEQERRLSEAFDPGLPAEGGKLAGARKLISGKIGLLGNLIIITLSLVDVTTGATEKVVTEEFLGAKEDIRKPVRIAAQKLLGIRGIEVKQGSFLSVEADPAGMDVFVNGLFEGSSPLVLRLPKPGKYAVKIAGEGYKTWTQNVAVAEDATYFVSARLLKKEKEVNEQVKALQDGRTALLAYATVYSAFAADAVLYTFDSDNPRLYVGLPLVVAPLVFYGSLRLTEGAVMNSGRSLMIMSGNLWGSAWGVAAGFVFGASAAEGDAAPDSSLYTGLSLTGGLLYGATAVALTWGDKPFPAERAWLFNLGSVLGSLLGLGVPYVLGAEDPAVIYLSMLSGSVAGSAAALYMTRDMTEGRSIGNLAFGAAIEAGPSGVRPGIPLPVPVASSGGERIGLFVPVARLSY